MTEDDYLKHLENLFGSLSDENQDKIRRVGDYLLKNPNYKPSMTIVVKHLESLMYLKRLEEFQCLLQE